MANRFTKFDSTSKSNCFKRSHILDRSNKMCSLSVTVSKNQILVFDDCAYMSVEIHFGLFSFLTDAN